MNNSLRDGRVIHKAEVSDINTITDILGDAFEDDPVINHAAGKPGFARHLFHFEFEKTYCALGHSYYLADKDGKPMGATMWAGPGQKVSTLSPLNMIRIALMILRHTGFGGVKRFLALGDWLEKRHIHEPHYYLHAIGVAQDFQGKGVGGALLAQVTAMADRDGVACYLESSKIENVPLYERHGFVVTSQENTPYGGPPMWLMRRPAPEEVSLNE